MIIWGTKRVEKRLGFIAENCPRCQAVRCVKVVRIGMAGHVYFIAVTSGRLLGHVARCLQCSGEFMLEPADYPEMEKNKKVPLDQMVERTNPMLIATKELHQREERLRAVREPFLRFNQSIEDRAGKGTHLDWPSGLAILGTVALTAVFGFSAAGATPNSAAGETLATLAVLSFLVGFIASLWLMAGEPKRFFRKRVLPQIRAELEAMRPERAELDESLARLAKYRYRIVRFMRPEDRTPGFVRA